MQIAVKISGMSFRDGQKKLMLNLPEGSTIKDVFRALDDQLPGGIVTGSAIAPLTIRNGRQAKQNEEVADGDLIHLLYILKGG